MFSLHFDAWLQIPEVYTPVLERLLVVQMDSFPQYSPKMQYATCRSIIKVFVAMAVRGPVLWSFTSSVGKTELNISFSDLIQGFASAHTVFFFLQNSSPRPDQSVL